jgi:hypothetical protein
MDSLATPRPGLELLPPEIQCQILQYATDPRALFGLIRPSPRYFQVFRQFRPLILSQMTRNYISHDILPIALEVLTRPRSLDKLVDGPKVDDFIKGFPENLPLVGKEFEIKTSIELLRFHNLVEKFMVDFTTDSFVVINNYLELRSYPPDSNSIKLPITNTEKIPLSRAFYQLELYGILFHSTDSRETTGITRRSATFLKKITEGQLEALLCVRTFLIEWLTTFLNQVEEDFMEDFRNLPPHPFHRAADSRWETDDYFFGDDMYPGYQELGRESCVTRGLHMLSVMFNASDPDVRCDTVCDTGPAGITLKISLRVLHSRSNSLERWPRIAPTNQPGHALNDACPAWSSAWLWARQASRIRKSRVHDLDTAGLRRWGYIIWD